MSGTARGGMLADTKVTRKRGHETTEGSAGCPADATAKKIRPRADGRRYERMLGSAMLEVKKLRTIQRVGICMDTSHKDRKFWKYLYIIGDHIEALLPEQEDLKCKVWSFVSSFTGQTWMTGQAMMMLYKGHNRPRRSERPEVQPPGLAQESSAQRPDSNKHARLGHKPRAQHGQDVGQASKSANMPNAHSLQAEAQTSVTPMQQQAVASPAHLSRAQNAEAQRSKEYSMEDILADLSQGTAQHKLNLPSRQADAGMGLSDLEPCQKLAALSMPGSWRRLQAEHEQQARYREMAKRLQDDYDIEAAAHEGFVVNRTDARTNEHESCAEAVAQTVAGNSSRKVQGKNAEEEDDGCCLCWCRPKEAGILHGTSMHKSFCRECLKELKHRGCKSCPICSEPIACFVLDIFS